MAYQITRPYTTGLLSLGTYENSGIQNKSNNRQELLERIMKACWHIRAKSDVLRENAHSILKRAQLCIEQGGNYFENLM